VPTLTVLLSPNPVNPQVGQTLTIRVSTDQPVNMTVSIHDKLTGLYLIFEFPPQYIGAGQTSVPWDVKRADRTLVAPGTYIVTVTVTNGVNVVSETVDLFIVNRWGQMPGPQQTPGNRRK